MDDEKRVLESFLLQNEELEKIESLQAEFNVFETLEVVQTEIRHTKVLAWLMNPRSNHGLGDQFLRLFLKYVFVNNREAIKTEISFFDIEVYDFDDMDIRKEQSRIDLLLISESNKFVVAIENKIESREHHDQLRRYHDIVTREFPGYNSLFIYLTPDGLIPSDTENWIIFDYPTILSILSGLMESRKNSLSSSVYDFLSQYCTTLRRWIVPKSEIEEICRMIYQKHQQALDLIFQYKPDIELEVSKIIKNAIESREGLLLDSSGKTYVRFTSRSLDGLVPAEGEGWTASKRILLYEFVNYGKTVLLRLYIGPGNIQIRTKLHRIALKDKKLFNRADRRMGAKWLAIFQKEFLKPANFEEADAEGLKELFIQRLDTFLANDFINIEKHIIDNWADLEVGASGDNAQGT